MTYLHLDATDETFDDVVLRATQPVLLDFWAPWCAPCLALGRVLDTVMPAYADKVAVVRVNLDENPELGKRHGVRSIPRLSLYRDGVEVEIVEARTRARLEQYLDALA